MKPRTPVLVLLVLAWWVGEPDVRACAVCATADSTLIPAGEEQPFRGRVHVGVDARIGGVTVGASDVGHLALHERRVEASTMVAVADRMLLGVGVPFLHRTVNQDDGGSRTYASLGDVELRLSLVGWMRSVERVRQRFGMFFNLDAPTAPVQRAPSGLVLPVALQPGCSALVPTPGVYYVVSTDCWSFHALASLKIPLAVRSAPHKGDSLRASLALQWQPWTAFALRGGLDARAETKGELSPGQVDPNSGGFFGYAVAQLVLRPASDFLFAAAVTMPFVQRSYGERRETAVFGVTLGYDF